MDRKLISEKLVSLRGQMSQKEAAQNIGIKPNELSMYESGERIPTDEKKILIAKYYKKSVQSIFFN